MLKTLPEELLLQVLLSKELLSHKNQASLMLTARRIYRMLNCDRVFKLRYRWNFKSNGHVNDIDPIHLNWHDILKFRTMISTTKFARAKIGYIAPSGQKTEFDVTGTHLARLSQKYFQTQFLDEIAGKSQEDLQTWEPCYYIKCPQRILMKIIEFEMYHKEHSYTNWVGRTDDIPPWEQQYMSIDQESLFQIFRVALDECGLLELGQLCAKTVANMVKGKTLMQIDRTFNIHHSPDGQTLINPLSQIPDIGRSYVAVCLPPNVSSHLFRSI